MFRCAETWTVEWAPLCVPFRSVPVPQWSSERASLPVNRWPSHLCHGLWSHLLPLHLLLHVYPGMSLLDFQFTAVSYINQLSNTKSTLSGRGSCWSSRDGLTLGVSGTCWRWRLSSSAGVHCLSSSKGLYWESGTLNTIRTTKTSKRK